MRVICCGDSNTYGYDPRGYLGDRYPAEDRWVDILAGETGWEIQNDGHNGREIPTQPFQLRQIDRLLERNLPNLFLVMLGTNDLLMGASAEQAGARMEAFLRYVQPKCGQVLLIAPPAMKRGAWVTEESLITESTKLAGEYQRLSKSLGIRFADAGMWEIELAFDGVHFTEAGHHRFAQRLYTYIAGT